MSAQPGGKGFFRQGLSYKQEMMKKNSGNTAIDSWCASPVFKGSYYPSAPILDVSASKSNDKIYVNIVNRDARNIQSIKLCIADRKISGISAKRFYHEDIQAVNTFENPNNLHIEDVGMIDEINLEPLSFYVLEITLKET